MKLVEKKINIFFDGACVLCNYYVRFVIKYDKNDVFRFTPIESDFGKKIKQEYRLKETNYLFLIEDDKLYIKSSAILRIVSKLKFPINFLSIIIYCFPKNIRDYLYDFIAKKRYQWFGKQVTCSFLDSYIKKKIKN